MWSLDLEDCASRIEETEPPGGCINRKTNAPSDLQSVYSFEWRVKMEFWPNGGIRNLC